MTTKPTTNQQEEWEKGFEEFKESWNNDPQNHVKKYGDDPWWYPAFWNNSSNNPLKRCWFIRQVEKKANQRALERALGCVVEVSDRWFHDTGFGPWNDELKARLAALEETNT